ncbi:MAG: hypothetical protein ACFFCX_10285 [Candidatus Sifarchaeia archaeon]
MKRRMVFLILVTLVLSFAQGVDDSDWTTPLFFDTPRFLGNQNSLASVSGSGNDIGSTVSFSRNIQDFDIDLMNSFASPDDHSATIDLSSYQLPGWTLYQVQIDSDNITAIPEREVLGVVNNVISFKIEEYQPTFGWRYNSLTQGFYEMPHDGQLLNYSFYYASDIYSPAQHGWAYYSILSDYENASTNLVAYTQLPTRVLSGAGWENVTVSSVSLSANTEYYAVINGSSLVKTSFYPDIQWGAESGAGQFASEQFDSRFSLWGGYSCEALLNYTYIPWNTTADTALVFSDPLSVDLNVNGTPMTGSTWTISSTSNITTLPIDTNQSVSIRYDLTLRYRKNLVSSTTWYADESGESILWNITSILDYPELGEIVDRNLTLTLPADWTATHLFNTTYPTQYYDHFTQIGSDVTCVNLDDETWVLNCTSPNYLQSMALFDISDDSTIIEKVSVSVTMDINGSIQDQSSNPAINGNAQLRVFYQSTEEYSEDYSVSSGISHHQWDISADSSSNGLHTIDLSWSNGTEAGYLSSDVVVYYETSLVADEYTINDYTEDSFYIGIDYDQVFPVGGIDNIAADVTYSFGAVVNQSLTDQGSGRWDATVSTASMTPGHYDLYVYAEGYALENKSITIQVILIHDTEALTFAWSNTNDITYIETTELSVYYNRVTGSTPIPDAIVNVTIGTDTWTLTWDGSSAYKITFNGTDALPGFGAHSLTIEAWKVGHKEQSDSTQTLTIQEEPTTMTYEWSNTNSITYIESTTLSVNYTQTDGSPVLSATVNATIGVDTYVLVWNGLSETYDYTFDGDAAPGIGVHSLTIEAGKFGYVYKNAVSVPFTITEEPTTLLITWSNGFDITYIQETYLIANYTMSDGSPVLGATVNVTIDSDVWILSWYASTQVYRVLFRGSDIPPGFGTHSLTIRANLFGYVSKTDSSESLTLSEDPTTLILSWSAGDSITYIEQTILSASYTMSNSSAIQGATVNVTISGTTWQMTWHAGSETYRKTFLGSDDPPGFGIHSLTVQADLFGFVSRTDSSEQLTMTEEPTSLTVSWSNGFAITYVTQTTLSVSYEMSDTTPISGATVTVTIGVDVWPLTWNPVSEEYEVTFRGDDNPPGLGVHSLSISASRTGFVSQNDNSETLTISNEPTSLQLQWWLSNTVSYVGQTILYANFTMSNGSAVVGAFVNATIGTAEWTLEWNGISEVYQLIISGDDPLLGVGTHSVSVQATLFGYDQKTDSTQTLTINDETTSVTISWSNTNSITFLESTVLSVSYEMSNGTPIPSAVLNVTIDTDVWTLTWNPVSEEYEKTFLGSDDPPGFGTQTITIRADKYGYQSKIDSTNQLIISEEPTNLVLTWSGGNSITYVESTTLIANYTLSDGSAITGAVVNVTIGLVTWVFVWNGVTETYDYTFYGIDDPPGFGVHSVTVEADKFGHVFRTDSTQTLTISVEPTAVTPSWSPDNNITYVESTTLSVRYDMSNGTAIPAAMVNITIGVDVWVLVWNPVSEAYEITFSGEHDPPGYGTHSVEIKAWKFGYASITDSSQELTIRIEETSISFEWNPSDTITYVEGTTLKISYLMSNGTPIQGATVNITRGATRWDAVWNATSQTYDWSWLGIDDPPGLGSHGLLIRAWKENYIGIIDTSQTLTIDEEPTNIQASWSTGNNITYVESTKLRVNFTDSSGIVIPAALVDVTIGSDNWILSWNATSQLYEYVFSGSDIPPNLGTHSLSIRGWQIGYEMTIDGSQSLTLRIEPTTLTLSWTNTDTITFVESTTVSVRYVTSYGDSITGASVNITIGTDVWVLVWNPVSEEYETTFDGSDDPPGFGVHSLFIQAWKYGYQDKSNSAETLMITEEPTSFIISWSDSNNITYVKGTTLSVRYQMSDTSAIPGAVVNATIDGTTWTLTWNPVAEAYERYFAGSEDPLGYGTHTVEIRASKFGYVSIIDSTQQLTIRLEDTSISFAWSPSDTITFVESTRISISYVMGNGTPITGATVNLTIGTDLWVATWNITSEAYEISFLGTDDPPGLGLHILVVRAWKTNYVGLTNSSEKLTINEEPTQVQVSWTIGNSISFTESTRLHVNYTASNGTTILAATVNVTIGVDTWALVWNGTSQLYEITFSNGSAWWPGLGTHGLTLRAWKFGYQMTVDITQTLTINSEQVDISSTLLGGSTITFIESTILQVNYTTSDGDAISGATVNVKVGGNLWDLVWHAASQTYRIQFNGSDADPGFGTHNLIVNASALGFDALTDSSLFLTIQEEPTTLTAYWQAPNFNSLTYFEYTILYVEYQMSNGSDILGASVNVTIDATTWTLGWNSTAGAYSLRFDGSDNPPGLGTHSLLIKAALYGYMDGTNSGHSLTLAEDPTSIEVSWTRGNNITYVEYTVLSVVYRMSNGTVIDDAIVNATIGVDLWVLSWNETAGAYQIRFDGDQIPPGLGTFVVDIEASAKNFVPQSPSTSLTLRTEGTTATASWSSMTIDWTESVILSFDYRDSYGILLNDATTKLVYVDGGEYTLLGTNGTYWIEFNNTFDLGLHSVWANFSKFGYDPATALSISITIVEAPTDLALDWSSTVIDYLGQIDLAVDYYYVGDGSSVPPAGVVANITIDGSTYDLTLQNGYWIANLTGVFLDLGSHTVDIRAQVYGYEYSESLGIVLTVNEVITDALVVTWTPSNLTIEYTDSLSLVVDYTFYGGDVPATATVNVSIDSLVYDLTYAGGVWSVSIPGSDLGIGVRTATVNAWFYGYQLQADVTVGLNVTVAANSFIATWDPLDLQATYIDTVNLSVVYTEDFVPIAGATVELSINGTVYTLTYSAVDQMWHFSMKASDIGLGIWNVTVTANKTGYADGWDSRLLTVSLTPTNLTVIRSSTAIYYDESITLNIYYEMMNTTVVPGATCIVTVDSVVQSVVWVTDHWTLMLDDTVMGLGVHSVVVDVDAFGYEPKTDSFPVTVNAIPTSVIVDSPTYQVYPFDSITISFTWWDDKNSLGLSGSSPGVTWPDTSSVVDLGNGTYLITVENDALHVGIYQLNVTFTRTGYEIGTEMVQIEIVELPIVLTYIDEIEQFENETITVSMQMYDGPHAAIIDWGEIVIELEGVEHQLIYDLDTQTYTVDIWLSSLEPGNYTLNFTATATDCETEVGEIQLVLVPKILYTIAIDVDEQIQAGQTAEITIQVSYESGPITGFDVLLHIIVERGQGAPQEFLETASDTYEFLVPVDATGLTVWAEFEGSIGEWPAISNTVNREVTPGGIDILSYIISLFEDPITLTIIIGGGGSAAGLLLLRRRRRGGIPSTSVADPVIAPTTASAAPVGEMEMLQDKIKGSSDGLTRPQIAQSLEISTSKAGAMVKKLLEENPAFEEIREGRLRRIRFRGED